LNQSETIVIYVRFVIFSRMLAQLAGAAIISAVKTPSNAFEARQVWPSLI